MSVLSEKLDKIASSLESQGMLQEAEAVDMISNTLEAFEKEAWEVQSAPMYKILQGIFKALKDNNAKAALSYHMQGEVGKRQMIDSHGKNPESASIVSNFAESYDGIKQSIEGGDIPEAVNKVQETLGYLKSLSPVINKDYSRTRAPGAAPVNPSEMIFTTKKPGMPGGRAPIQPPARAMR